MKISKYNNIIPNEIAQLSLERVKCMQILPLPHSDREAEAQVILNKLFERSLKLQTPFNIIFPLKKDIQVLVEKLRFLKLLFEITEKLCLKEETPKDNLTYTEVIEQHIKERVK